MKVSLVLPNLAGGKHFLQPPIDFLYASSHLKKERHTVYLIDNRAQKYSVDELSKNIPESDIIIFNTAPYDFSQMYHYDYRLDYSIFTINEIRRKHPDKKIILTGMHSHVNPALMLESVNVDAVLRGEIDLSIANLVSKLEKGHSLADIENLVLINNEKLIKTPHNSRIARPRMEDLLFPDYDLIDFKKYYGYIFENGKMKTINHWGLMMGTRGCPYSCNFCHNFWGKEVRKRSPQNVVNEVVELENKYGVKHIFFYDSNFTLDKNWVIEVLSLMKKNKTQLSYSIQTRLDLIDNEILGNLEETNCNHVFYGLESFNDETLSSLNKRTTTRLIEQQVRKTKEHGIMPFMFIMLGVPGETAKGLMNTLQFLSQEEVPFVPIVYGPRFGSQFLSEESKYDNYNWDDLMKIKGLENNIPITELSKIIKYVRKRNYLNTKDFENIKKILKV